MSQVRTESPEVAAVVCTLGSSDLATQVERWKRLYADAGSERVVTDNGLRVLFRRDAGAEGELRELVAVETGCCAWAQWTVEGDAETLVLEVSSSGAGIAVIHSWFLNEDPVLPGSDC